MPEEFSEYILAGCLSRDLDPYLDAQLAEQMVSDLMEFEEGKYIGEAINRNLTAYNECAIERTDEDRENMQGLRKY